jgi:uncharacterized membrane protein YjjP (DUF1212 family)
MQTVYDWVTVAIFAGLIVIFLQRSVGEGEPQDSILSYLPPAVGCAVANYFGNEGLKQDNVAFQALAALGIVAVLAYTYYVIKPFQGRG